MISRRRMLGLLLGLVLVTAAAALSLLRPPPGPRSLRVFAPKRLASLELQMWQAYYGKARLRLLYLLVVMLREQFRYRWIDALRAGFHLARAAATFGDLRSGYERVLPDLVDAYDIARRWTGAGFDPHAVAAAELGWWVARRAPGQDAPAQVGARIADLYALLYEVPRAQVVEAAQLRADAAALRDKGGDRSDWPAIDALLQRSYRSLRTGLSAN